MSRPLLVAHGGTLTWFSRSGNPEGTVGDEGHQHINLTLSNDASKAAYYQDEGRPPDLFTIDVTRATVTRLTTDAAPDMSPVWSPDGTRIAFLSRRTGRDDLYVRASDGSGSDEPLFASAEAKAPSSWSPDGRTLLYTSRNSKTRQDVWALSMTGTAAPTPLLQTEFVETNARFSPDGRWIAYISSEGGLPAVFVRPFPVTPSSPKWQVSALGVAGNPHWRRDGREIVYRAVDGRFMAVDISLTPSFAAGPPRLLFTRDHGT